MSNQINVSILLLASIIQSFGDSELMPEPCFLKCKDNYMNAMQFDMGDLHEWSTDMITPINSILKSSNGKMAIRLNRACRRNEQYYNCLKRCPNVPAKEILIKGQHVWMILCHDYHNDSDFRTNVVPCWSEYGQQISRRCDASATFLQSEVIQLMQSGTWAIKESLESLCKSISGYDKCFVDENYDFCGSSAARFLVKLNHQTSHTILELLDKNHLIGKLPKSCKDWLNQKGMSSWQKTKTVQRRLRNSGDLPILAAILLILPFLGY